MRWGPTGCRCDGPEPQRLRSPAVVTPSTPPINPGSGRRPARSSRALAAVAGLALAAGLVACGQERDPLDQPHLGGERFTEITFEGLPRPANSTQIAYLATGLNQQEDLEIPDASVDDVLDWYDDQLRDQGWNRQTGPEDTRDGTLVTYERMGRTVALLATNEEPTEPGGPSPALITVSFNKLSRPGTKQEAPRTVIQTTTTQS